GRCGVGAAAEQSLGRPACPPDGLSPGGPGTNGDVDGRQEADQDDGIKHEEQRVGGLDVEGGQCRDDEDACDDGIPVVAVVAGPRTNSKTAPPRAIMNTPTRRGITSPSMPFDRSRRRVSSAAASKPKPPTRR